MWEGVGSSHDRAQSEVQCIATRKGAPTVTWRIDGRSEVASSDTIVRATWLPGSVLVLLAAFSSPWTGIRLGGLGLTDYLLAAAALVVLLEHFCRLRRLTVAAWMVAPTVTAFLLWTAQTLSGTPTGIDDDGAGTGITFLLRTFLGLTLVAVLTVSEVETFGSARGRSLLGSWASGAIASAGVAISDSSGLTSFYSLVEHVESARSVGLANHPNSLAQSLVLVLPIVILTTASARSRSVRVFAIVSVIVISYGLFLANSRGGLLVGLLIGAGSIAVLAWRSGARRFIPSIIVLVPVLLSPFLLDFLETTRLAAGSASESDALRLSFLQQGWQSFAGSPIVGSALEAGSGVMVPLYLASLGGIALLIAYYWYIGRNLVVMVKTGKRSVVTDCLLSGLALVGMGLVNNSLNERFDYWSICVGASIAILATQHESHVPATDGAKSARR